MRGGRGCLGVSVPQVNRFEARVLTLVVCVEYILVCVPERKLVGYRRSPPSILWSPPVRSFC